MQQPDGTPMDGHGDGSDLALMARLALGDRDALDALYARHSPAAFAYLNWLTPDRCLAEELLQDTFFAAWRGAAGFAGAASVRSWLLGIARRRAHDAARRRTFHLVGEAEAEKVPAPDPPPEERVVAQSGLAELSATIAALPVAQREVFILVLVRDLSYAETAQVLGIPVGTVKSRLSHARRAVRAALDREGTEP